MHTADDNRRPAFAAPPTIEPNSDDVVLRAPYLTPDTDRLFRSRVIPLATDTLADLVSVTQWLDELLAIAGDVAVRDDGRRKLRHFRNRLASFTHAAEMDPPTRMERGHIAALLHALADRCYPPPMSYDDKYGNDTRLRGGVASDESD